MDCHSCGVFNQEHNNYKNVTILTSRFYVDVYKYWRSMVPNFKLILPNFVFLHIFLFLLLSLNVCNIRKNEFAMNLPNLIVKNRKIMSQWRKKSLAGLASGLFWKNWRDSANYWAWLLSSNKLQLVDTCNFSSLFFITLPRTKKRM